MTDTSHNPEHKPKASAKGKMVILSLAVMIVFAGGLSYSNSQKREAFKQKVEEIKITDQKFVKDNDCWLLDVNLEQNLSKESVQFFASKSSNHKNFHYKCADGRGYQSNVYIGSQDAKYLSDEVKAQLISRLKATEDGSTN